MPWSCHNWSKTCRNPLLLQIKKTKECIMQAIQRSYRSLSLLLDLNWDRALYIATIIVALAAGAFVGSL
jgi:hypothetical protein